MRRKLWSVMICVIVIVMGVFLAGCGPSKEQLATQTVVNATALPTAPLSPTSTEAPTQSAEPSPTTEVFDPQQKLNEYLITDEAKQSIDKFIKTINNNIGTKITPEQIIDNTVFKEMKDEDGNIIFVYASYNLPVMSEENAKEIFGPDYWQFSSLFAGDYLLFIAQIKLIITGPGSGLE